MSLYDLFMYPFERLLLSNMRKTLISNVSGDVLEIGIGTGVNFKYYNFNQIESYTGVDVMISDEAIKRKNGKQILTSGIGEDLIFLDNSFDFVVVTLVLCSVHDARKVLEEINRVLKPNGEFIFIEHVLSDNKILEKLFYRIDSTWNKFTCCTLCSKTDDLIKDSNLEVKQLSSKFYNTFCFGTAKKHKCYIED